MSAVERPLPQSAVTRHLIPDLPTADELLPFLKRIDESRWYSNFGPLVCEFEERLQSLLSETDTLAESGPIHLTTLASGYQALEVALRLTGVGADKRVLVPAITFSACPLAVLNTGAQAVLAEVDPETWSLTEAIARAAAERTQVDAVMPVAVYGIPIPVREWDAFSEDTGIPVIIDAAAAIDAQDVPRRCLVAHSLHATKPFGVGEGGVLAGRDADIIANARICTNFGMIDRIGRMDGTNAKMSEYHAAVGLAQLARWNSIKEKRKKLLDLYLESIEPLAGFVSVHPTIEKAIVSSLMLLLETSEVDAVFCGARHTRVSFHRTYLPPLYQHPRFSHLPVIDTQGIVLRGDADDKIKAAHMPICARLGGSLLGVPFHTFMKDADVMAVVNALTATLCSRSAFHVSV